MAPFDYGPIVLLTDFGVTDAFVGVLKGVIARINQDYPVIDLSHGVAPQSIQQGAFVLATAYRYFPENSIFCVVVDPGVGSDRKKICIRTKNYIFVGPDNGVLWEAACQDGIVQIIQLDNDAYFLKPVSATFHGRDVFAPVCAHISSGLADLSVLGPVVKHCQKYTFPEVSLKGKTHCLSILNVDRFGNITLNLKQARFDSIVKNRSFVLTIQGHEIIKFYATYAAAKEDELFLIGASNSYVEICMKNASAHALIRPILSDVVTLEIRQ